MIGKLSQENPDLGLDFWKDMDTAVEYFNNELVSFDLFDNGVGSIGETGFQSRYIYHQQEALWNEIFIQYFDEEKLDKILMENLSQGFVVVE